MLLSILYPLVCRLVALLLPQSSATRAHEAELLALRHEVLVLRRQLKRTRWCPTDRLLLCALSRCLPRAEWARFPVRPETLLRWHRALHLRPPLPRGQPVAPIGPVLRHDRLGGPLHECSRCAA